MFTGIRLHSQFIRDLEDSEEEITDSFIKSIKYPNNLGIYLEPLEFCILNKITYSIEIIKGVINLSDFLLLDESIYKKLLDYKNNITIKIEDKELYINVLDNVRYIITHGKEILTLINKLCYLGLLDILKFIGDNYNIDKFYYLTSMDSASSGGQIEIIKFLKEECNIHANSYAITSAARNGHIKTIKLLKETYDAPIDELAMVYAASNGHIEIVKLLKEEYDAPIDKWAISNAACHGHIEIVKLLKEKYNAPIDDEWAISNAARHGHIEIVKLLKSYV